MNRNYKTSSLTEAAMITGILVIIAYASEFIPLLMPFYPTPALILAKRKGLKYATLSLVAAGLIISMLLGIQTGIIFLLLYSPIGVALAYGICRDEEPNKTILMGSAAFMISFVAIILMMQAVLGINYIQQLIDIYSESIDIYKNMLKASPIQGDSISQSIQMADTVGKQMVESIGKMFPAMIIISSVMMSAVNYLAACRLAKRFSIEIRQHEGLNYFSFPKTFMYAMAILLLLSYGLNLLKIDGTLIQSNLFMIFYYAMGIQGMAVLSFFLAKKNVAKGLRVVLLIFAFFSFIKILGFVGIIDLSVDFRKIRI
jgi:uncharacterized protein YybS (DUF2232 family)